MSVHLEYAPHYLHSATPDEITRILTMPIGTAQQRVESLEPLHDLMVGYDPIANQDIGLVKGIASVPRIAQLLNIELTDTPVSGQYYLLAPSRIAGGVALWRQRVGTVRPLVQHRRRPILKSERLG